MDPVKSSSPRIDVVDGNQNECTDVGGFTESSSGSTLSPSGLESASTSIREQELSTHIDTPLNMNSKQYAMNGARRGKVLIFNQITFDIEGYGERNGTESDVNRLKNTLPNLGFQKEDIHDYPDMTYKEIKDIAKALQTNKDLESSDCLMVIILTHGSKDDILLARDRKYYLHELLQYFTPSKLQSMAGKPKIFIIQACRGNKMDKGVKMKTKLPETDSNKDCVDSSKSAESFSYPRFADFLLVMSSHRGYTSFRNDEGSWLIQELCNVIENCELASSSIFDILLATNCAVSRRTSDAKGSANNKKQISNFYSTFTKQLYFE